MTPHGSGSPYHSLGYQTTTVVPGLTDGTTVTFTVTAANGGGLGPPSVQTMPITIGAPAAPRAGCSKEDRQRQRQGPVPALQPTTARRSEIQRRMSITKRRATRRQPAPASPLACNISPPVRPTHAPSPPPTAEETVHHQHPHDPSRSRRLTTSPCHLQRDSLAEESSAGKMGRVSVARSTDDETAGPSWQSRLWCWTTSMPSRMTSSPSPVR